MIHDSAHPMGDILFNILNTFAEFEVGLLRMRTPEVTVIAKAGSRIKGRALRLSAARWARMLKSHAADEHTVVEPAGLIGVSLPMAYRLLERAQAVSAAA